MLTASDIYVKYNPADQHYAISNVSFNVKEGERVALIGANGAGKSTLLLSLCGVIPIEKGSVTVCGITLEKQKLKDLRQKLGMVFQNPDDQLFMPTVYEDIAFGPRNYGYDELVIEERINKAAQSLGISHLIGRMSHKLSGGEKRLAALAGVLVMEPAVLLMDEPSSFLDPMARRNLITVIDKLPQTIVMTTHDLDMALELCKRAIVLKDGAIFADTSAAELFYNEDFLHQCGLEPPLSFGGVRKNLV